MNPGQVVREQEVLLEQLEVKCVVDEAWYNADVEVLDDGIHVRFDGFNEDDEIWDIAYLRKHAGNVQDVIRLTSPQLQDEQCRSIKEGMVVCARGVLENDEEDEKEEEVKYFDARIVNVDRNHHTFDDELGEECCTCVFEAYWITGPYKKEFGSPYNSVFFTCADICLLNPRHVESHPVVQKILHLVDSSSCAPRSQVLSDHSGKSHPRSSLTCPSRSREASSNGDRALASEQSGNPDFNVRIAESVLNKEASTSAERETSLGGISEQSRKSASASTAEVEAEGESDQEEDNISAISISSDDFSTSVPFWSESSDPQFVELKVGSGPKKTVKIEAKVAEEKGINLSPEGGITRPPLKRMRGSVDECPAWFKPSGSSSFHLQTQ
ncbi:hypothetical protein Mapa_017641 [Marchantia paleacea]|nr:hypothetical protein Mapa_017641 [Marchantia paleacea]